MNLDQIPLLAMLKGKLGYLNERQKLIAQNVANADTPGYAPSDLKAFTVASNGLAPIPAGVATAAGPAATAAAGVNVTRTNQGHLSGKMTSKSPWKSQTVSDSEARLDGNQVVLEDQMIKMGEVRMDFDAAIGLYQKSLGLIRLATRKPGA